MYAMWIYRAGAWVSRGHRKGRKRVRALDPWPDRARISWCRQGRGQAPLAGHRASLPNLRAPGAVRERPGRRLAGSTFEYRKIADGIAMVLALFSHDNAQAAGHREGLLGITRRRSPGARSLEFSLGEPIDDASHDSHAVRASRQHLRERRTGIEVDANRRRVGTRIGRVRDSDAMKWHRLVQDRPARPRVGREYQMAQRLGERPLVIDTFVRGRLR